MILLHLRPQRAVLVTSLHLRQLFSHHQREEALVIFLHLLQLLSLHQRVGLAISPRPNQLFSLHPQ